MKKHGIQILISLLIVSLLLSPVFVYGYVKTGEGEAALLQEGSFTLEEGAHRDYYSPLKAAALSAEEYVYQELMNVSATINVAAYNIPVAEAGTFLSNVVNDHPDLFFVSSSYSYNYYPSTGTIANLFPSYAMDAAEIAAAQEIYYAGAEKALATLDSSMSDLQKALTLHDYICSEALYPVLEYNSANELINDRDIWHSAYGFFYNQTVVCAGFTLAYSYLLDRAGIKAEYVASDAMTHAWNKVKIDGSWYNVDLTYDNFDISQGKNTYGQIKHSYFLKSDAYFAQERGAFHFGGATYDDCTADSTLYDDAFWDGATARIYVVNGDYYYLKTDDNNVYTAYLTKRTENGAESPIGSGYSTVARSGSIRVFDENNVQHSIPYTDTVARLAYLDNRFYITAGTAVYAQLLDGGRYTVTPSETYVLGLGVDEDDNLFYQLYGNSNATVHTLDKREYFKTYLTAVRGENYNNYPDLNLDGVINAKDWALIIK